MIASIARWRLLLLGPGQAGDMTLYLLVRDADGAILAEYDSPGSALRALEEGDDFAEGVSVVRFDDHQGELVGTTSFVTARLAGFDDRRS